YHECQKLRPKTHRLATRTCRTTTDGICGPASRHPLRRKVLAFLGADRDVLFVPDSWVLGIRNSTNPEPERVRASAYVQPHRLSRRAERCVRISSNRPAVVNLPVDRAGRSTELRREEMQAFRDDRCLVGYDDEG